MTTSNLPLPEDQSFWQFLFAADTVAVIGAKDTAGSWGFDIFRSLLVPLKAGISRKVYAVNPNVKEILSQKTYSSILDIPGPVELAVIVVSAAIVPSIMRQCVKKQVRAAVIVSAGFSETGQEGSQLQSEVTEIARQGGIRFIGPNCLGHADRYSLLDIININSRINAGPMAVVTQSGTTGYNIVMTAANKGIGLSKFVGTGNEADLHFEDYLEFLARDQDTRIITGYIEGLREARRFLDLAKNITLKKPIVVIKVGATSGSSRAAKSHTGALAGSDNVYSAAFRQSGVIRVEDEDELCDIALALIHQPLPRGSRVGIFTMGGGPGVLTAEACEKEGLTLAEFEPETLKEMDAVLPQRWSHGNPVDLAGMRNMGEDNSVPVCIRLIMQDKNVDGLIAILPTVMPLSDLVGNINPEYIQKYQTANEKFLSFLYQLVKRYEKPIYLIDRRLPLPSPLTNTALASAKAGIPEYSSPHRAARVFRQLKWYQQYLTRHKS